jgi:hypothetical protein
MLRRSHAGFAGLISSAPYGVGRLSRAHRCKAVDWSGGGTNPWTDQSPMGVSSIWSSLSKPLSRTNGAITSLIVWTAYTGGHFAGVLDHGSKWTRRRIPLLAARSRESFIGFAYRYHHISLQGRSQLPTNKRVGACDISKQT